MVAMGLKLISLILVSLILIQPSLYIPYVYGAVSLHEDPEAAGVEVDASLLLYYSLLLKGILYPEKYNLTSLMELYRDMSVPSDLSYILTRLNELILNLNGEINETRLHIDNAVNFIKYKAFKRALEELYDAKYSLSHANLTYQNLLQSIGELHRSLGKYHVADTRILAIRKEMSSLLSEIDSLLENLFNHVDKLREKAELGYEMYYEGKERTFLSIYVNSSEVWVGRSIEVNGRLYTENVSLSNRTIYIDVMGRRYSLETDLDGYYNITIVVPYVYVDGLFVRVFYIPIGPDLGNYTPANNETWVKLIYISTKASLNVDEYSYPGLPLNISISVSPSVPKLYRNVSVYMDDVLIGRYKVDDKGLSISYPLPSDISIGQHIISVYVEAYREYSPVKLHKASIVTYVGIKFRVAIYPNPVLYPLSKIVIHGCAIDMFGHPISHEAVKIYMGEESLDTYTDGLGNFSIEANPPFSLVSASIRIVLSPSKPWYTISMRIVTLYVINLYLILLIVLCLGVAVYLLDRRLRRRLVKPPIKEVRRVRPKVVEDVVLPILKVRRVRGERYVNSVLDMYYSAVDIFSRFVEPPRRDETLREYFDRIDRILGEAREAFWSLTLLAEYTLYSGRGVDEKAVDEARRYYDLVRRFFHG